MNLNNLKKDGLASMRKEKKEPAVGDASLLKKAFLYSKSMAFGKLFFSVLL
jgi:hypothetical protein